MPKQLNEQEYNEKLERVRDFAIDEDFETFFCIDAEGHIYCGSECSVYTVIGQLEAWKMMKLKDATI